MSAGILITGPPRSGKTTLIQDVSDRLGSSGYVPGGIYCPELRSGGERVGFEIVDIMTGEARTLAHVDRADGPAVGKYHVDVAGVDALCSSAFARAFDQADFLIVDEIAPMEVHSEVFVRSVHRALAVDRPLLAAIHFRSTAGFIGDIKDREDTDLFDVTEHRQAELSDRLVQRLRRNLEP